MTEMRSGEESPEDVWRRLQEQGRGRPSYFLGKSPVDVRDSLVEVLMAKEGDEREGKKEILSNTYERIAVANLRTITSVCDDSALRLMNSYPYDSRYPDIDFQRQLDDLDEVGQELSEEKEADAWLNRLVADVRHVEGVHELLKAGGPLIQFYYDGVRMMRVLTNAQRSIPTGEDFKAVFAKDLKGLEVADDDKKLYLLNNAKEGVRKEAVDFQDDNLYWRMLVSAVSQYDYTAEAGNESFMKISPVELALVNELFCVDDIWMVQNPEGNWLEMKKTTVDNSVVWKIIDVDDKEKDFSEEWNPNNQVRHPKLILNYYAMKFTEENRYKYMALMESLLLENAREETEKLEKTIPEGQESYDVGELDMLIGKIRTRAEKRIDSWYSRKRTLRERLAEAVTKYGIAFDYGLLATADLGWVWEWSSIKGKDEKGNIKMLLKKKHELGSIYSSGDIITVATYAIHEIIYDQRARIRTPFFPPSDKEFQNVIKEHPPGWGLNVEKVVEKDETMRYAMDILGIFPRKDEEKQKSAEHGLAVQVARGMKEKEHERGMSEGKYVKGFNGEYSEVLEKLTWGWVTPYKDPNTRGKIIIPMFFPTKISTFNFWNTLQPDGRGTPTLWNKFSKKERLSNVNWDEMGHVDVDNWHVSMEMMGRWLQLMVGTRDDRNDVEPLLKNPGKLKELIKRVDLGTRHEKVFVTKKDGENIEIPREFYEVVVIPQLIAFKVAADYGIIGAGAYSSGGIVNWKEDMAKWLLAMSYLPDDKGEGKEKFENYNGSMMLVLQYYIAMITKLAGEAAEEETDDSSDMLKNVENIYKTSMSRAKFT